MKNKKIKVDTGSEKLTKEEINSHKDFKKVYKTYTSTTTHVTKTPKKFGTLTKTVVVTTTVVVATIGAWKYYSSRKETTTGPKKEMVAKTSSATHTASQSSSHANATAAHRHHPYIHPPVKGVDVPYKSYAVDAARGGTFTYNGSKIIIPAGAFCNDNGKDISGKVIIKYREFHNPVDFFVSGIPMTYDSAGKQYTFESAGMLDVRGYQDGKEVHIKPGKEIKIAMVSTQTQTHYNMYYLDTTKQNWDYKSKSKYAVTARPKQVAATTIAAPEKQQLQQAQNNIATTQKQEAQLEKQKPVEPEKVSNSKFVFNIEASPKEFPELSVYKNMLFEPDANDKNYKPGYANITWDDARLKRNGSGASYTFTVKKGSESHSFLVHPVFEGKDYATAMKEYNKKYAEYQAAYTRRKTEEKKEQDEYDAMMAKIKKEQQAEANKALAQNTGYGVVNYFSVNNFGIWNSDAPDALPRGADLAAQYTDNKGDDLNNYDFYLVEKNSNALFIYHPGHNCRFNPKAINYAWSVTPDNHIAIYSIDDFSKIKQTSGDFTFTMKVADKKITSFDDVKEIFKPYM